jgi:hypothetical protein
MSVALASYLAEVEQGLLRLPRRRRKELVREIEMNLLDEAESLGLYSDEAMEKLLQEKEAPRELARTLYDTDDEGSKHRSTTKLLAGALLSFAAGGYLFFLGRPWLIALMVGLSTGFAVGMGLFWSRRRWQLQRPIYRILIAMALGTLLAVPLCFASSKGFEAGRLAYGAFLGYLAERLSEPRRPWGWFMDNALFTVFIHVLVFVVLKHGELSWATWERVPKAMLFNLVLQLGVWGALKLQRLLDGRWILEPTRI